MAVCWISYIITILFLIQCKLLIIILSGIGLKFSDSWVQRQKVFKEGVDMTPYYAYEGRNGPENYRITEKQEQKMFYKVSYVLT